MKKQAAVILSLLFLICTLSSACGSAEKEKTNALQSERKKIVTLKVISIGTPPKNGLDSLYKSLDEMTEEELGCRIRIDYIPWGDERKQLQIAIASGEYDLIPNGTFSDYYEEAAKGAFVDLNQYRDTVPELFQHYEEYRSDYLEGIEIDNRLYGIPQFEKDGPIHVGEGFLYRKDLLEVWGLEPVTDLETMEKYLYAAKADVRYAGSSLVTDNRIWNSLWYMLCSPDYPELESITSIPYAVVSAENPRKILSRFETEEFQEILSVVRKWYQDGILNPSILASSDNEGTAGLELMLSDKKPCETNTPVWAVNSNYIPALYEKNPKWTYDFFDYSINQEVVWRKNRGREVSCISISSKSKNPETAVRLLEKLHTDQRYHDLLNYGVPGENYDLDGEYVTYEQVAPDNKFSYLTGGADFQMARKSSSVNAQWQEVYEREVKKQDDRVSEAEVTPLDGFSPDLSSIQKVKRELDAVNKTYLLPLCCGVTEEPEEDYGNAVRKLYEAGLQKYLDELQRQLDMYWEERDNEAADRG